MNKCGIYGIVNKEEKKVYIGKSNNIDRRWNDHKTKLSKGTHHNKALQESYDKYGKDAFLYKVIELVPENQYSLVELEYINKYAEKNSAYNVYTNKDELRFKLATKLIDNFFDDVRIDDIMECLSEKGHPLKIAVYGRYNDDEVFIHIFSTDFEQRDKETRHLYCNENYERHYFEIGVSSYDLIDIDKIVDELLEKIKRVVGWKDGTSEKW